MARTWALTDEEYLPIKAFSILPNTPEGQILLKQGGVFVNVNPNSIGFNTSYTPTGLEQIGTRYWNNSEGTTSLVCPNGTILDDGEEIWYPAINQTGGALGDGRPVWYAGTDGNSGKIKINYGLANGSSQSVMFLGVLTEAAANGAECKVTYFGKVRGIQTNGANFGETWHDEDILYPSPTVAGAWTNQVPQAPYQAIPAAIVVSAHASNGTIFVRPTYPQKLTDLSDVNGSPLDRDGLIPVWDNTRKVFDFTYDTLVAKDPTGFKDNDNIVVTGNPTNKTITLTGTVEAYYQGKPVTVLTTGWTSTAHGTDVSKRYYLSYDGTNISWSDTIWTFDKLQIAVAFYDSVNATWRYVRETHGLMPWTSHQEDHETIGTYKQSGGAISGFTLNSTTAANRRPDVAACYIKDEDLITINSALTSKLYTQFYLSGAGAVNNFILDAADIVPLSTNNPYYNQFTGGAWQQTLVPTGSYMSIWLLEMPMASDTGSQKLRHVWVQGQQTNTTLANEQAVQSNSVNIGNINSQENIFIGRIIVRYIGGNWSIIQVDTLTGTRISQGSTTSGNFLQSVATDSTLSGNGTLGSPLSSIGGSGLSAGSIPFSDGSKFTENNANLKWDNTTNTFSLKNVAAQDNATLGAELLSASGWTTTGWTGTYNSFTHTPGNTTALTNSLAAVSGKVYRLLINCSTNYTGSITVKFGTTFGEGNAYFDSNHAQLHLTIVATNTNAFTITPSSDFNGTLDFSLKEITPNNPLINFSNSDATTNAKLFVKNTSINIGGGNIYGSQNQNTSFGIGALLKVSSGSQNTAIGYNTLNKVSTGNGNTVIGQQSLTSLTNGNGNTAIGGGIGSNFISGYSNLFLGDSCGNSFNIGDYNVMIGNNTGPSNTFNGSNNLYIGRGTVVGANESNTIRISNGTNAYTSMYIQNFGKIDTRDNVAWGKDALLNGTATNFNVAIGSGALQTYNASSATLGAVAIGYQAAYNTNSTSFNAGGVFIGYKAGYNNANAPSQVFIGKNAGLGHNGSSGNNVNIGTSSGGQTTGATYNATVIVGDNAGGSLSSGGYNIFLGANAGYSVTTGANNLIIGPLNQGATTTANTISIANGNSAYTSCYIEGISGQTSAAGVAVLINSSHKLGTTTSSIRYKENVVDMADYSSKILDLRPVMFDYKDKDADKHQPGLIAEEVEKIMPELVVYNQDNTQVETVRYLNLIPLMLNEIKKLKAEIEELKVR